MAKEKFLIVAIPQMDDCFGRFQESENRANLDAGCADASDPYSWIEATFTIELRRYREATHLCSFTPSAFSLWLANAFVGIPNAAWKYDADPDGLENESGGEVGGYATYYDEYDPLFICETFTIDTVKDLGIRKPSAPRSLSRRSDNHLDKMNAYRDAIWEQAEDIAHELMANGAGWCDGLEVYRWRQEARKRSHIVQHLTA